MLEIQNVSKTFNAGTVNEKTALNGLNLKLNEGDFVTVIGGNGAGKSTMLNAVAGVWPAGRAPRAQVGLLRPAAEIAEGRDPLRDCEGIVASGPQRGAAGAPLAECTFLYMRIAGFAQ